MEDLVGLIPLIPAVPLLTFAAIAVYFRRHEKLSSYLAVAAISISWLLSMVIVFNAVARMPHFAEEPAVHLTLLRIPTGAATLDVGVQIDPLTVALLFMVPTVCLMIFIYSIGYMKGDPRYSRFFAYICLFATGMLGLVVADNLLLLFVSWEVMGLCSYLLIGFWFEKPSAMWAGLKAFITTRIGDVLLMLGMVLLYTQTGALRFETVFEEVARIAETNPTLVYVTALLVFGGAVGKSAQFPLHVWLPDAMEGPTPVSALIHAATMVAAGVFLVARMLPVFLVVAGMPALAWVAAIGAITALFASTIAIAQDDIKRVLAYSTISQLGYMIMALGIGGFVAAVFHLITHAFFKALLFLGSGSVIHGVGTNDMMEMGGLRKKMPYTFWTFLIGMLALAGVPPLAGFWSKDEILAVAFEQNTIVWIMGTLAAFITAFYMTRQVFLTFMGEPRNKEIHAHESPPVMYVPLIVLAIGAALLGLLGVPEDVPILGPLLGNNPFHHFLAEQFGQWHYVHLPHVGFNAPVMLISILMAGGGIGLGYLLYGRKPLQAGEKDPLERLGAVWTLLRNKYYIDEIYRATIIRGTILLADLFFRFDQGVIDFIVNLIGKLTERWSYVSGLFDTYVIDGIVNGVGRVTSAVGQELRYIQTGRVQNYLVIVVISVVLLMGVFLYM
ncbi:MAG TPA: NADH-quinone oxidoreductase subunit L [Chloroflexi bacterium]|nr:NADH-quinone oxidoreductase subunit L [Chloroflexota bacterium]